MSRRPRSDAPQPSRRPASRPKAKNKLLFIAGIFVLAIGAFYTALVVATQIDQIFFPGNEIRLGRTLSRIPGIDSGTSNEIGGGRINVLVMGVDKRPADGDLPSRTDTLFVMSIDPATSSARGLGIPRDLYVEIQGSSNSRIRERINAAYVLGETFNYPGGGIGTVERTVENLLGIEIDYYVMINFEGFKEVIDLLGGIDVEVPPNLAVDDPTYSDTELLGDFYPCEFDAGIHHMDGKDALCYSRTRYGNSDLDRILRQQLVMLAVVEKAKQLDFLSSPDTLVSMWRRYKNTVSTDINDQQIPGFARLAAAIDPSRMSFLTLGPATTSFVTAEGAQVLQYSAEGVAEIVRAFTADDQLNQEAALVEIQNGTGLEGRASAAVDYFVAQGMPRTSLVAGNAATSDHTRTEIIDFSGKAYTSNLLASWMGVSRNNVRRATEADMALRSDPTSDIVIILGTDAKIENAIVN